MIAPLLTLTLALSAPASAAQLPPPPVAMPADTLGPARRAAIDVEAADWVSAKSRAYRMMAAYRAAVIKDGWDQQSMDKMLKDIRALCARVEDLQYTASEMAKEQLRAAYPPSPERLEREQAIEKAFQVRALTVYANLVPRILDESTQQASHYVNGRVYAGPEWRVALTFDEGGIASRWHITRAGFSREDYEDIENRAADALGQERPKRP